MSCEINSFLNALSFFLSSSIVILSTALQFIGSFLTPTVRQEGRNVYQSRCVLLSPKLCFPLH